MARPQLGANTPATTAAFGDAAAAGTPGANAALADHRHGMPTNPTIVPADTIAPPYPTGIVVTPGDRSLTVTWNPIDDVDLDYVEVAWREEPSGNWVSAQIDGTLMVVTGLTNGVTYNVRLRSVDTTGNTQGGVAADPEAGWVGSSYRSRIMGSVPYAYWRLGESSGTVAKDEMGVAPGTYTGPAATKGVAGAPVGDADTAVFFPGSYSYVALGAALDSLFAGNAPFSVSAYWKYNAGSGGAYVRPFGWGGSVNNRVELYVQSGQIGLVRIAAGAGGDAYFLQAFNDGLWHHLVGTFDGTSVRSYSDGVARNTVGASGAMVGGGNGFIAMDQSLAVSLVGSLDEVAVWNRELTAAEIADLFRVGNEVATYVTPVADSTVITEANAVEVYDSTGALIGGWNGTDGLWSHDPAFPEYRLVIDHGGLYVFDGYGTASERVVARINGQGIEADSIRHGAMRGGHNMVQNSAFEMGAFVAATTLASGWDLAADWNAAGSRQGSDVNVTTGASALTMTTVV